MSEQEPKKNPFEGFRIEIDPERIEQTLKALRERVQQTVTAGRYTKVRLSYKGKPVMPDLPLGVFLASEGLAFWLVNPLAALLVNIGARAILDVEFLHEKLAELAEREPRQAEALCLHQIGGLTVPQVAEMLDVSASTVERDIALARTWLAMRMK